MATYVLGVHVVDVAHGDLITGAMVVAEGERMVGVHRQAPPIERGGRVVDLNGAYLVPGLWNVHTHPRNLVPDISRQVYHESLGDRTIRSGRNLLVALSRGITGVRSCGDVAGIDIAWRNAFRRGEVLGPNIFACGEAIAPTGGHFYDKPGTIQADGPAAIRAAVRSQLARGVDQIKLMISGGIATPGEEMGEPQALPDEIEAAVEVAHLKRKRVTVHAGAAQSVKAAVRAGVDCVKHGYAMDEEAVALMAQHRTYYVPTLFVTQYERFLSVPALPAHHIAKVRCGAPAHLRAFRMALEAGIKMAAGADTNPIGEHAFVELEMLVQAGGMTPMEAIRAGTLNSAEVCGADKEAGSIEVGKLVDLLAVSGNPLENISALRDTRLVMRAGKVVMRAGKVVSDPGRLAAATTFAYPFMPI